MAMQPAVDIEHISDLEFLLFKQLIAEKIGVDLPPHKKHLLVNRLRSRLTLCQCKTFSEYYEHITRTDKAELRNALDLITTNETYFFRESQHFAFLESWVQSQPQGRQRSIRVWTAACSSGEEPYSIAMTLANSAFNWEVLATDINRQVLQTAQEGIYLDRRTEGIPPKYRKRYCREGVDDYAGYIRICPQLRSKIDFQLQNLTQAITVAKQPFDIIFLRNVMIYFDIPTRVKVVSNIAPFIAPGGYLIISHSESLHGIHHAFDLVQPGVYQLTRHP